MSQKVKEKYTKNKATQFDNFHEQFIVLKRLGFPHIRENNFSGKLNKNGINNPQVVFAFKNNLEKKYEDLRRSENLVLTQKAFSKKVVSQKEADQIRNEIDAYTKNGYYAYFKNLLASNVTTDKLSTVNICVFLDVKKLSLTSGWVQGENFRQEVGLRNENIKRFIESDFPAGTYFDVVVEGYCDARLDATLEALEYIYAEDFVVSIVHPEIYLNTSMNFTGF